MRTFLPAFAPLAAAAAPAAPAALSPQELAHRIKEGDAKTRGDAWQEAGPVGAAAIPDLALLLVDSHFEVARAAQRALRQIVRFAGRPGATKEARAVEAALIPLLANPNATVRRQTLWLLSEIGDKDAVKAIAPLLNDPEVRDDARCALERIPGKASLKALQQALQTVPENFRYAIADSLRKRGEKVVGYPSQKLVPTRPEKS